MIRKFSGKTSGKTYTVQKAHPKLFEDIKYGMAKYFIAEEPICKFQGCDKDEDFIKELYVVWDNCLQEGISLSCTTVVDGNEELAGFLLLTKALQNEHSAVNPKNEKWKKLRDIMNYATEKAKPYETLNIKEYLTDMALLVFPDYRRDGVGENLLQTCDQICIELNLPATIISVSSYLSQNLSKKIGMKELYSIDFRALRTINEKKYGIDGIEGHTEAIKFMYKLK